MGKIVKGGKERWSKKRSLEYLDLFEAWKNNWRLSLAAPVKKCSQITFARAKDIKPNAINEALNFMGRNLFRNNI